MKTIIKICRPIAIFCAAIAFVVNVLNSNWLGATLSLATLVACI